MEMMGMEKEQYDPIGDNFRQGRHVFHILPELYEDDSGYQAVAAVEGLQGFYQTRLYCGHDYEMAVWYAAQKNLSMGIDAKTATEIIQNAFANTPLQSWNKLPI
jgi:hypothetical protein